jgi:superfamily I DNA and/or RNA helicase
VVLSMCSSDGVGGRGLEFLLSENRMNVAISRGKCLAIVVGNPDICKTKVSSIEAIKLLNMYCKLIKYTVE